MLTSSQIDSIVAKIQSVPKLPKALKRGMGEKVFKVLVLQIDSLISTALPPEVYALVNSASDGLTPEETEHLETALNDFLKEKVKSPVVQSVLPLILPLIVDEIVTALQKGKVLA